MQPRLPPRLVKSQVLHQASGSDRFVHTVSPAIPSRPSVVNLPNPPYELVDYHTPAKEVFMLQVPIDIPRELAYMFDYQFTVFNSIRLDNETGSRAGSSSVDAFYSY